MPETYGDMIACNNCGDWYNVECVGLERLPPKQEQWNCNYVKQVLYSHNKSCKNCNNALYSDQTSLFDPH